MADNSKTKPKISELTTHFKFKALEEIKGEFFQKIIIELTKMVPDDLSEIWQENIEVIKRTLKAISYDSKALVFKENGKWFVASSVWYFNFPNFPDSDQGFALVRYLDTFGTVQIPKWKFLMPSNKEWVGLFNNEKDEYGTPIPDVSLEKNEDKLSLSVAIEYAANIWLMSASAKGIMEFTKNPNNEKMDEETITEAILKGFLVNDGILSNTGTDAFQKVIAGSQALSPENFSVTQFNSAPDLKTHFENYKFLKHEYFSKNKSLKDFEKLGSYNAHNAEINEMKNDRTAGVYEKINHIEKNISLLLSKIKETDIEFVFDIEKLVPNTETPEQENKNKDDEEVQDV